jgi:ring-1,2-phenylacetyl-CoA epoxidase subunit PaaE
VSVTPRGAFHALAVAEVSELCDDAVAITFDVPAGLADVYAFRPGQSVTVRRVVDGVEQRRSYSICAPAGASPRIGVREVPDGAVSAWLVRGVRPGDRIDVQPPSGSFTPDVDRAAHHVLIVAGSGITPALSIVSSVLANPGSRVTVFYGNRRTDTVMFADELADLKDRAPTRVELVHVLSREPRQPELFSGRLDAAKLRRLLPTLTTVADVDHWWLCGPYGMVVDAQEVLGELEVSADRIHRELFYVEDTAPPPAEHAEPAIAAATSEVTIALDGRRTTVPLDAAVSILEGAQRVRPDLPFACKGGVCGTCRARVTSGTVDLRRNFALDPAELAAGFVLTCQSYATAGAVTVDFDT